MRRLLAFAVCGLSLGACTSGDLFKLERTQVTLRLESEPPGADAKVSSGPSCKTPCAVPVEATGELTVTYTLEGYLPQEALVQIVQPADLRDGPARANPNPVYVELEAAPRPPGRRRPAAKRPAPKKPVAKQPAAKKPAAKKPAAKRPAAKRPATPPPPAAAPEPAPAPQANPSSPWPPAPGQPAPQR